MKIIERALEGEIKYLNTTQDKETLVLPVYEPNTPLLRDKYKPPALHTLNPPHLLYTDLCQNVSVYWFEVFMFSGSQHACGFLLLGAPTREVSLHWTVRR